jgi:hypothetical protein
VSVLLFSHSVYRVLAGLLLWAFADNSGNSLPVGTGRNSFCRRQKSFPSCIGRVMCLQNKELRYLTTFYRRFYRHMVVSIGAPIETPLAVDTRVETRGRDSNHAVRISA